MCSRLDTTLQLSRSLARSLACAARHVHILLLLPALDLVLLLAFWRGRAVLRYTLATRLFAPVSRVWAHVLSWVQKMAGGSKSERLEVVGDEWSTRVDVLRVIHDFILVSLTTAPRRHERCFVRAAQKGCTLPLTVVLAELVHH